MGRRDAGVRIIAMATFNKAAKAWRLRRNLTVDELSKLSGYAPAAIYGFERGDRQPGVYHTAWAQWRYQMVCAAVDHRLQTGKEFKW